MYNVMDLFRTYPADFWTFCEAGNPLVFDGIFGRFRKISGNKKIWQPCVVLVVCQHIQGLIDPRPAMWIPFWSDCPLAENTSCHAWEMLTQRQVGSCLENVWSDLKYEKSDSFTLGYAEVMRCDPRPNHQILSRCFTNMCLQMAAGPWTCNNHFIVGPNQLTYQPALNWLLGSDIWTEISSRG